jgi:threonine/homoserine/homoserine lactone efflux protein
MIFKGTNVMGQAIGQSITTAIGVAISPIPIIAVILMLLSKRAGTNSLAFAAGWIVGIAGALTVIILISSSIGTGPDNSPSGGTSTTKIVIGAAFLLLGGRYWRKRPAPGEAKELPKWLSSIEAITPGKSFGLGIGLSVVNPKNLLLLVAGGLAIAGAPATSGGKVVAAVVFVLLAVSTVVLPVLLYKVLGDRAERSLESLNKWLQANNATVMSVLLLVIGVDLIGKGIGGF